MKFEEEFPSLKGKWVFANNPWRNKIDDSTQYLYLEEDIKEKCFDKQRVRKILIEKWKMWPDDATEYRIAVMSELGL